MSRGDPAAAGGLADIIAEGLAVLFCGINPGLSAAATGHHFAGRGNRFWQVLHLAGFTPERIAPEDDRTILQYGCGLTALVARPTARAEKVAAAEFRAAAAQFERRIGQYAPRHVALLGKAAYAALSGRRAIAWGRQPERLGPAALWVLPNPSGRNRAFGLQALVEPYRALYRASGLAAGPAR